MFLVCFAASVLLAASPSLHAADGYFTLSTTKSFSPSEQPKLHLYTQNVDALEFRIYRVRDPEAFAAKLEQMHSFGDPSHDWSVTEQIDEKTWLERFHDWKADRWYELKQFFRSQFSKPTRDAFKAKQSGLVRRSVILNAAQFAQIPLLNDSQLVARWRQQVPPTFVSDNQILPVQHLDGGMYLVEATDGHLKAYTLLLISRTALITRMTAGELVTFVVDRGTGVPVAGARVSMQLGSAAVVHKTAAADGTAVFAAPPKAKAEAGAESDSSQKFWAMARSGDEVALAAPYAYSFTQAVSSNAVSYVYTDRPVYRPGNTVHFKAVLRNADGNRLVLPGTGTVHAEVSDEDGKTLLRKDLQLSPMGTLEGEVTLPADARLGFDRINFTRGDSDDSAGSTSFRVEEYRKPEYQVRVSVAKARVLEGENNQATIEAKYFFGEPVANAKVKYRVYQSRHYWWGDPDDDDSSSASSEDPDTVSNNTDAYNGDQNSEQTGKLDGDGKLTVPVPTRYADDQFADMDYVVEAGVTDEAGREITGRYRFIATRGSFRVHVEPVSYLLQPGSPAQLRINAVDYDNRPVQTTVHVKLQQRTPGSPTGSGPVLAEADVNTGADGTASASLPVNAKGDLDAIVSAKTPEGRTVQDDTLLWFSGGQSDDDSEVQTLRILPDKKSYAPGDTAHIAIVSPVAGFHVLVTATGNSVALRKVLATDGKSATLDLPITQDSQPNLVVDAVFLREDKLYQGRRNLRVPPNQQRLQLTLTPAANTFQPGQAAAYDVTALDAAGRPVAAEFSLGVVDEAIYALYPDDSGDIVKQLYPDRSVYPDVDSSVGFSFSGEAGTRSPQLAMRHTRYGPHLAQVKPGNDAKAPRIR